MENELWPRHELSGDGAFITRLHLAYLVLLEDSAFGELIHLWAQSDQQDSRKHPVELHSRGVGGASLSATQSKI